MFVVKCLQTYLASVQYRQDETLGFSLKSCQGEIKRSISTVYTLNGVIVVEVVAFGHLLNFKIGNKGLLSLFIIAVYTVWLHFKHCKHSLTITEFLKETLKH